MLSLVDLKKIARARLKDARVLYKSKRYDGAIYLCGYAIEVSLKLRICKTLNWIEFPEKSGEFGNNYKSFKTHNLDVLLHLSGVESKIKNKYFTEWSGVAAWDPEVRYQKINIATDKDVVAMLSATATLLKVL